jgi:hypothetical protein
VNGDEPNTSTNCNPCYPIETNSRRPATAITLKENFDHAPWAANPVQEKKKQSRSIAAKEFHLPQKENI